MMNTDPKKRSGNTSKSKASHPKKNGGSIAGKAKNLEIFQPTCTRPMRAEGFLVKLEIKMINQNKI